MLGGKEGNLRHSLLSTVIHVFVPWPSPTNQVYWKLQHVPFTLKVISLMGIRAERDDTVFMFYFSYLESRTKRGTKSLRMSDGVFENSF